MTVHGLSGIMLLLFSFQDQVGLMGEILTSLPKHSMTPEEVLSRLLKPLRHKDEQASTNPDDPTSVKPPEPSDSGFFQFNESVMDIFQRTGGGTVESGSRHYSP